jgi:hypothetical protein
MVDYMIKVNLLLIDYRESEKQSEKEAGAPEGAPLD